MYNLYHFNVQCSTKDCVNAGIVISAASLEEQGSFICGSCGKAIDDKKFVKSEEVEGDL